MQLAVRRAPQGTATEITTPVEHQHLRLFKRRWIKCRSRMRAMMVDQRHPAVRKTRPQVQMQPAFLRRRNGTDHRHTIHFFSPDARQLETHGDGLLRKPARLHLPAPHEFRLLYRRDQLPVAQNCARCVVENAADSQNDHRFPCCAFSILAQVSRSATVRLKTSFPPDESASTQKYPSRSN